VTQVFKAPAALLDDLGITEPTEIVIEAIAQHCGATIVYEPLHGCDARILGVGDRAIVTVNSNASRQRQRFSAAHELGHWMRDRGKVAFACTEKSLVREWGDDNPERRANRYAADLLLPRKMFQAAAHGLPPTFSTARAFARTFESSLTATAIRLVELGELPAMLVCTDAKGRLWFFRSAIIPEALWPLSQPGPNTNTSKLVAGTLAHAPGPELVDASDWIDHRDASEYVLIEDAECATGSLVLTLLWWKNEAQIVSLENEDEGDAEAPLSGHLSFGSRRRKG
jgi:hypothetical protein